jgi:hypothetical protein
MSHFREAGLLSILNLPFSTSSFTSQDRTAATMRLGLACLHAVIAATSNKLALLSFPNELSSLKYLNPKRKYNYATYSINRTIPSIIAEKAKSP